MGGRRQTTDCRFLPSICYLPFAICYLLPAICPLLSAICYLLHFSFSILLNALDMFWHEDSGF